MSTFPTRTYQSASGKREVTGELVAASSNAYMVAVDGKVETLLKEHWFPKAENRFEDMFGSMFGGGAFGR